MSNGSKTCVNVPPVDGTALCVLCDPYKENTLGLAFWHFLNVFLLIDVDAEREILPAKS